MATIDPISIKGLRDLQSALKALDGEAQKELRLALNEVAQTVAKGAGRRVPTRSGRAQRSLKVGSSQREAKVKAGGNAAPYYPWLDFGGRVGRNKSVERRFITQGRYIYPTYFANRDSITRALEKQLTDLIKRHGLEVD